MARGVGGHGPANIMKHMKDLHFPAKRKQIIAHAKKAPGPDTNEVVKVLEQLPDKEYHSPVEVMEALGHTAYAE